jgi:hypothetical protein
MKHDLRFHVPVAAAADTATAVPRVAASLAGKKHHPGGSTSWTRQASARSVEQDRADARSSAVGVVVSIQEADVRGFTIGDRVSQLQYGTGTVRLVDEHHTVIDFDEHGLRRFATAMVKLERSATVEPDKPPKRTRKKAAPKQD